MLAPWAPAKTNRVPEPSGQALPQFSANLTKAFIPIPSQGPDASVLHLLVVDDDDPVREGCIQIGEKMGFAVRGAASVPEANAILKFEKIDVLLLDLKLPGGNALSLLEELKIFNPSTEVVVMTAYATVPSAVRAMQIGANHYITKPFALEELTSILDHAKQHHQVDVESRRLRERLRNESTSGPLIGRSPEMEKLYRILSKVSSSNHPVMIQGESGTGKETVARFIHFNGVNADKKFIPVDCGLPGPSQIENELFGYTKGAFAGAIKAKEGLLGLKDGGTVFLDEIGDLNAELQSRLLRALQDREFRSLGTNQATPVSVRVLAASSRDLNQLVDQGRFRRDLYLRLNMVNLKIPPLRERATDIPLLALHFINRFNAKPQPPRLNGEPAPCIPVGFDNESFRIMTAYEWPGNVRQLEEAVIRACTMTTDPLIPPANLPSYLDEFARHLKTQGNAMSVPAANGSVAVRESPGSVRFDTSIISIADMEKRAILNSIRQLDGDKLKAAKLLGIGKTTLYRKLKEYGISEEI